MGIKRFSETQTVFELDTLDGHQFEDAIYDLFLREGYQVEMGARTNDKGRDLILRLNGRTVVVECKHYIGSVGRPVVQKLHSSIQTFGENASGLLVTTGSFTQEAIEYADEVRAKTNVHIDLVDFKALVERGNRVGLYFVSGKRGNAAYFQIPWRVTIQDEWTKFITGVKSCPRKPESAVSLESTSQLFYPLFWCDYQLQKVFETSVTTLHVARAHGTILYSANLARIGANETKLWQSADPIELQETSIANKHPSAFFDSNVEACLLKTAETVAQENSVKVNYRGKNNQHYAKACIVQAKDVRVSGKRILVSKWLVAFGVGPRTYELEIADRAGLPLAITEQKGFELGSTDVLNSSILCNDCALIVPTTSPSAFKSFGSACSDCGRTLCKEHYFRLFRLEVLPPKIHCSSCYPSSIGLVKSWNYYPWFLIAALLVYGFKISGRLFLDLDINILGAATALFTLLYFGRLVHYFSLRRTLKSYAPSWRHIDDPINATLQHDETPNAIAPSTEKKIEHSDRHPPALLTLLLLWTPILTSLTMITWTKDRFFQFESATSENSQLKSGAASQHSGVTGSARHRRNNRHKMKQDDPAKQSDGTDIPAP